MRKIKHGTNYGRHLKDVPKGVCDLCGGKGRYKETFTYKNPMIHHCSPCRGTGRVPIRVKYIGETVDINSFWHGSFYDVISESDTHYVLRVNSKEMVQVEKELFE